jgi:tRNA threonylcarbamoyladenosine modification (KEOPS) complex  Pcc1 subunit
LWRATTSPEWEHVQKVGSVLRATLKLSKDNVIFAVRAVDASGHRSFLVVPTPEH